MRYILLINSDKAAPPPQKAEMEDIMRGHQRFAEELQAAKKMVHGERLRPDAEASRIRLKAGQRQVTDGPFAETKEVLGGFAVVDVPDDAQARYWAGRIAVAVGWPQEVHRFPHRIRTGSDARAEAAS